MVKKSLLVLLILILAFLGYVASRNGHFAYERSGIIRADPAVIFPYLSNFKLGNEWSPYEKVDLKMKKTYSGPDSGVGAKMEFEGNSDVGSGRLEILKVIPNELVELRLDMIEPMAGSNVIQYKLSKEADGTRFTWSMTGEGGFLSKLMAVLIDCDKMIGDQFSEGIKNLKQVIESKAR